MLLRWYWKMEFFNVRYQSFNRRNIRIIENPCFFYASGVYVSENSDSLLCRLEDGVVFTTGLTMIIFHGDPLLGRVNEIIDRVVEAGLYKYWISLIMNARKLYSRKIVIVQLLDGYYSFNLHHMQLAFYLLLMGWCLSAL
jgi:hypothetical protein